MLQVSAYLLYKDIETFNRVASWLTFIRDVNTDKAVLVLCGNKIDLQQDRTVSTSQGEDFAKKEGMLFYETSAKSGVGVNYMIYSCVARLSFFEELKDIDMDKVVEELEDTNKNKEQSSIYDIVKERDNELHVKGNTNDNSTYNDNSGKANNSRKKDTSEHNNNNKQKKKKCC